MNFEHLLKRLKNTPLAGITAHKEMSFTNRNFEKPVNAMNSAVCIILFPMENTLYFPLIKRPENLKHHKGQIALPGGKINDHETIIECAFRESEEEIGIKKENLHYIKTLTDLYIPVSNHLVYPVLSYSSETPVFSANSNEVEKIILCNIEDLINFKKQIVKVKLINELQIEAPAFIYKNEIIWGATALILNEFKYLLCSASFRSE